ncbi:hypothetical protein ACFFX0_25365 [Citricoccus parietis]|uniref:Uncharacterized protein n=1 Tax=Citricoccus parietis TaxID=592307 RepID=A0ABV5G5X4_9MICC
MRPPRSARRIPPFTDERHAFGNLHGIFKVRRLHSVPGCLLRWVAWRPGCGRSV